MKTIILLMFLVVPEFAFAEGVLTPAANPPQPISVLSVSGIPFIKASSGTMGNNGAVSAMTALPRIYSSGAYLWLPAGAIAAGVPASAAWYWFVASSTTAGTVYNSTYTSGTPTPGVLTAFATTGPGAFTGSTSTVTAASLTLPANLMGRNGQVWLTSGDTYNNNAGNKAFAMKFGATNCWAQTTMTIQLSLMATCTITNRGVLTAQTLAYMYSHNGGGTGLVAAFDAAENTAANVTIAFTMSTATATDHAILESYSVTVLSQQ